MLKRQKRIKVVLIGAGAVGSSFLYAALNQGLANNYGVIDVNQKLATGHCMDLTDANWALPNPVDEIVYGGYELCADANLVVVTASRPQKPGETRLEMVADNAKIITMIAQAVKNTGFDGISLICANPVDVLTTVYQQVTGYAPHKVISSGTSLDSARLAYALSRRFQTKIGQIEAVVLGEHGDSSFIPYNSYGAVDGVSLQTLLAAGTIKVAELEAMANWVRERAYQIIAHKGATYYGIGAVLVKLAKAVLDDARTVVPCGILVEGHNATTPAVYCGMIAQLDQNGWQPIKHHQLTAVEETKFQTSLKIIRDTYLSIN